MKFRFMMNYAASLLNFSFEVVFGKQFRFMMNYGENIMIYNNLSLNYQIFRHGFRRCFDVYDMFKICLLLKFDRLQFITCLSI